MSNIQELMDLVRQRNNQQDILAQPSIMDDAQVDPDGTAKIKQAQQNASAVNTASGVLGSIGSVGNGIKLIPSALDNETEAFAQQYKNAPSFFQKYGRQAADGSIQSGDEAAIQAFQQQLRDQAFKERYANQLQGTKFQNVAKALGDK